MTQESQTSLQENFLRKTSYRYDHEVNLECLEDATVLSFVLGIRVMLHSLVCYLGSWQTPREALVPMNVMGIGCPLYQGHSQISIKKQHEWQFSVGLGGILAALE
jgi:hypothetical protein